MAKARKTAEDSNRPQPTESSSQIPRETIEARAYELFLDRGAEHGSDVDDWLRAEREAGGAGREPDPDLSDEKAR